MLTATNNRQRPLRPRQFLTAKRPNRRVVFIRRPGKRDTAGLAQLTALCRRVSLLSAMLDDFSKISLLNGRRAMRRARPVVLAVGLLLIGGLPIGCSNADAVKSELDGRDAARGTYAEFDHEVPAHKPDGLPESVPALRQRNQQLRDALAGDPPQTLQTTFSELQDIVNWLPELAADSDLRKVEWDQVQAAAKRLDHLYAQVAPAVEGKGQTDVAAWLDEAEQLVATIESIVERHPEAFR
jgi:hypothetical protein